LEGKDYGKGQMDVKLRIIGKGKRCLGHGCKNAWKVRMIGKNSFYKQQI